MAGTGFFDKQSRAYVPYSIETWDDYQGTSAGDDWDSLTTWQGTPSLPLEFVSSITDYGKSETLNYFLTIDASVPATVEVRYGDTVDSAGGAIDGYSTVTVTPGSTGLQAKKGRYWQFKITLDYDNSAGSDGVPGLKSLQSNLSAERITETISDVVSSTLGGSIGARQLVVSDNISSIVSIITQPHTPEIDYVEDGYVAASYIEEVSGTVTPMIYVNKDTDPITLNIYDIDSYGKRRLIDCTFDAIITGNIPMQSDASGSIVRG